MFKKLFLFSEIMHLGPGYCKATGSAILVLKAGFSIYSGYIEVPVVLKLSKPHLISSPKFQI